MKKFLSKIREQGTLVRRGDPSDPIEDLVTKYENEEELLPELISLEEAGIWTVRESHYLSIYCTKKTFNRFNIPINEDVLCLAIICGNVTLFKQAIDMGLSPNDNDIANAIDGCYHAKNKWNQHPDKEHEKVYMDSLQILYTILHHQNNCS